MTPSCLPPWLFVSYGGGHVKALLPVAQRVQALGFGPAGVPGVDHRGAERARGRRAALGFRDFLEPGDGRARREGEALAAQLTVQAADREESIAYLGLSMADLQDRLGLEEAQAKYRRFGRQAFLPLRCFDGSSGVCNPGWSSRPIHPAPNAPRSRRRAPCTSQCLPVDLLGLWERNLLARHDYADAICVLNEGVRQHLVAAGRPAAEVHVTGTRLRRDQRSGRDRRGTSAAPRQGWDGLHVCLYASSPEPRSIPDIPGQGDPDLPRRIERALVEAVIANSGSRCGSAAIRAKRRPMKSRRSAIHVSGCPRTDVPARVRPCQR